MTAPALPLGRSRVSRRLRVPALATAIAFLVAVVVIASTGGGTSSHPRAAASLNSLIHGAPLQRARCANWLAASPSERALAVRALTASVGGPTEYRGVRGTALTTSESYALLDSACASPVARNFLLYELYIRAAGFRSAWAPRDGL